mmetsp:Transcript_27800/g.78610  ORF Transcript_27800/g.78610 Transcript_27800/m.78610 type:complete len:538 (+) Transcript_27800:227-1840(+)
MANPNPDQSKGPPAVSGDSRTVIIVVGSTGVGKSKLAIDLARSLGGEVVNADALQVYRGLAVTTNQVSEAETQGIPHHLIGFLNTDSEYTAHRFRNDAIPIIEDIAQRGKVPIIVGGSNYYVQALVSLYLLDERLECQEADAEGFNIQPPETSNASVLESGAGDEEARVLARLEAAAVTGRTSHEQLQEVDPVAAARIHPNDIRKAARYLELCRTMGRRASDIFRAQSLKLELRYRCCWIWVDAEQEALEKHLQARVLDMLRRGLHDEVQAILAEDRDSGSQFSGIRQAIGVKEFERYFCSGPEDRGPAPSESRPMLSRELVACIRDIAAEQLRATSKAEAPVSAGAWAHPLGELDKGAFQSAALLLEEGVSLYLLNTSRLARRQRRRLASLLAHGDWDLNRIDVTPVFASMYEDVNASGPVGSPDGSSPPTGNHAQPSLLWQRQVHQPALEIAKAFLTCPEANSLSQQPSSADAEHPNTTSRTDPWTQRVCEACNGRVLRGDHEWEAHIRGRSHRKRVSSKRRQVARQRERAISSQ